jgi:hypothetical protein
MQKPASVYSLDLVLHPEHDTAYRHFEDAFANPSWRTGRVHLGFRQAFDVIRPRLDATLARLTPGRTLWFCGHSLGAALATLAAGHYVGTRGVSTLGSPRVGDTVFARAFDAKLSGRSLRYVNGNDLVTHVPRVGYKHVELGRFIAPDGSVSSGVPALAHVFGGPDGEPGGMFEVIDGLSSGRLASASTFLLDHMPKAYAIWMWNDRHANK